VQSGYDIVPAYYNQEANLPSPQNKTHTQRRKAPKPERLVSAEYQVEADLNKQPADGQQQSPFHPPSS
jgi:hypothetical protein